MALLRVDGLQARYGASQVLFDISFEVGEGEVVTLLGRNGMGKTTTVNCLTGLMRAAAGSIEFAGARLVGAAPYQPGRAGIGLVPEGRQVFPTLTVRENLVATASTRNARRDPWTLARVYALFPRLAERAGQLAGRMSGGEQQMLAIGRALMTNPKLLVLDEATEGLAPLIRQEIWNCLRALKSEGLSMVVIDKNLQPLLPLAERHHVIEKGRVVWRGDSDMLREDWDAVQRLLSV